MQTLRKSRVTLRMGGPAAQALRLHGLKLRPLEGWSLHKVRLLGPGSHSCSALQFTDGETEATEAKWVQGA